jgi:phospholipid/cholesterol/gamma-HCH transport system ATP-binding protein
VAEEPVIDVQDVYKAFAGFEVLKGISIQMMAGTTTVILGGSGSGKTVLMKHIMGLFKPDRGRVLVDGKDISHMPRQELSVFRQRMGMVFQSAALFDSMTVFDNVAFPLREKTKTSESDVKKKVDERLEQVGLGAMGGKLPAELSGGMKKRAGLARALIMDPEIVLFDEPTTGLDPVLATSIHQLIARTHAAFGFTGVIVSHTIPQVFEISDYVAMLAGGVIEEVSPPAVFSASQNPRSHSCVVGVAESEQPYPH